MEMLPDQAKAAGIWYEAGEWRIRSLYPLGDEVDVQDLCASGFPFCGTYVEMEGLHADCMAVMIDGNISPDIAGDRHLTNSMKYSGEKGFAETPDAPSCLK